MSNENIMSNSGKILSSLKNSGTEVVQGVQESLLLILKFSYDTLPRNIQECFLSTSILRWLSKDELLELWMGLGLINNLQQAYPTAREIFKKLEESCLLQYSSDDDYGFVRLHDYLNYWNKSPFVEIPSINAENWRFANRVIISGKMPKLTYLELSSIDIGELPKDIKCLVNLQYLNISFTQISSLPKELELQIESCPQLEQIVMNGSGKYLKKLKISDVRNLQNITFKSSQSPPEFFHALKKLEISGCNLDNLALGPRSPCLSSLQIDDCVEIEKLFYIEEEREIQQQEVSEHCTNIPCIGICKDRKATKISEHKQFCIGFPSTWMPGSVGMS
ncbi:putative disease resistance protein At1g63350 [Dioscorea cayenensis subsp. rotundata]|uniref:Disease resistance protein At1g63350 n=1 Tax=Dioscorea cayennensis subsp. rotundata TaxID=55577 RepID=A0AB40ARX1_DIOCR|nr:putative disease resistance protein At1g63350 [Dioscorea cayenensis subsp. rotundata]